MRTAHMHLNEDERTKNEIEKNKLDRVIDGSCKGSSRPIIAEFSNGKYLIILRGAAQGTDALVSKIIVSEPTTALRLPVLSDTDYSETSEKQEIAIQRRKAAYVAFLWKRLKPREILH